MGKDFFKVRIQIFDDHTRVYRTIFRIGIDKGLICMLFRSMHKWTLVYKSLLKASLRLFYSSMHNGRRGRVLETINL